jgi:hypothetical protein
MKVLGGAQVGTDERLGAPGFLQDHSLLRSTEKELESHRFHAWQAEGSSTAMRDF